MSARRLPTAADTGSARRFAALPTDAFGREALYDALDVPMSPGAGKLTATRN